MKFSELLSKYQIEWVKQMGLDPDSDALGTLGVLEALWTPGKECSKEFLFEPDGSCDAQGGHSSMRDCGIDGCSFLCAMKPNLFDEKYEGQSDQFFKDRQQYPVYRWPSDRVNLDSMRRTKQGYEVYRAKVASLKSSSNK